MNGLNLKGNNDPLYMKRTPLRQPQTTAISMTDCLQPSLAFAAQFVDFAVQASNDFHRLVDRSAELGSLALPAANALHLSSPPAHLCVDFVAQLALGACGHGLHDKFHAACLAHSVLLGTVLSEVSPLPIATGKAMLVKKAHVSSRKSWGVCQEQQVSSVFKVFG
jgi:hypothetical protein